MVDDRSLSQVVDDIENGVPIAPDETVLVTRLAAQLPPVPARAFVEEWEESIRSIVRNFAPANASVSARAQWLQERYERFANGGDWQRVRFAVLPPYTDPLRVALWRLAKFGPLPKDRKLRAIIAGE